MIIKIEPPWFPTSIRGNYLYWKNSKTGDTRKTYITEGQLVQVKKEVSKYQKLVSGMGYPWTPVRYDGEYIVYKSSVSGVETKSYVPPEMRDDVVKFLQASGEPGKARVIDLHPVGKGKYAYIDRGNFTTLRETLTVRDKALAGFGSNPYTVRAGKIERVIDGKTFVIDGVVVESRNTETPGYKEDKAGYESAKKYSEDFFIGKNVTLKILINQPRSQEGNVLADIIVDGKDVAGMMMVDGHAVLKSAEPQEKPPVEGLELLLSGPQYFVQAEAINFMQLLREGKWGTLSVNDRMAAGNIFKRLYEEKLSVGRERMKREWGAPGEILDTSGALLIDIGGNIAGDPLMIDKLVSLPYKYVLRPGFVKFGEYLNKFDPPKAVYETGWGWQRLHRLFRQTATVYNPLYHIGNFIGDSWNALLGGLRNPQRVADAHILLTLPPTVNGARVVFTSTKGKQYTIAQLRVFEEQYHFEKIGLPSQTAGKLDVFDKFFTPGQKLTEYENARMRYALFLDRLQKGDAPETAFEQSKHFLIDYDKTKLTNFERSYLEPNIPFYMWMRQNTALQVSQISSQPQTYATLNQMVKPLRPTPDEMARLRDYQQNQILVRNPLKPDTFIRIRLPVEALSIFDTKLTTPEKAILLLYPEMSMFAELVNNRNFFDNTKISKDIPLYLIKKFSASWYWKYKDFVTLETGDAIAKQFGLAAIEPKREEYSVNDILMASGMAKTYEMMQAEMWEQKRKDKAESSKFFQDLVDTQSKLPQSERDRAKEFGVIDWPGFPEFSLQAQAINFMVLLKTGKWGTMTYQEKIGAGTIFRRLYEEKLYTGRMRMRKAWGIPGEYLDVSGAFLIELGGNIAGDPLSVVGFGRGLLTKVWQVGSKEYPATRALEQLYIQLARTRGEREAKWLAIQAAKANPAKYIQREGLRILGTQFQLLSQHTVQTVTTPIWSVVRLPFQPVKYVAQEASTRIPKIIDYLKSIGRKQDVISLEELQRVKAEYRQMTDRKRLQKQLVSTDIWILKQEAKQTFTEIKESNIASAIESLKKYKEISKQELEAQKVLLRTISEFKTSSELDVIREALEQELKTSQEESRATLKFISGEFKLDLDRKINSVVRQIAIADIHEKSGLELYRFKFGTRATERSILENSKRELKEMEAICAAIEAADIDAVSAQVTDELNINQEFARQYGVQITNLVERGETLNPKVGIVTRQLERINKNIALRETERGLLTGERDLYMRHWITPEARTFFGIQEPVLSKLAVNNLFNLVRKDPRAIDTINKEYMKKYGFNLFEPNAFKIQEYRAFESIEAVETYDYLMWIKQMYGITPEQELAANFLRRFWKNAPSGYSRSKIALLNDVYLPSTLVKQLESNPMFAMHIKTTSPKSWFEKTIWGTDTAQRLWRFGVTFGDPSWLPSNIQSGIYVATSFAKVSEISSYTNAWKELARRSELLSKVFKMSSEGGYFTDVYGNKILASELIAEAKEAGVLGVEGMGDISRNYKFGMTDTRRQKIQKAASWLLKNSEDAVRFPAYYDLRINKGKTVEEATSIIMRTQGNYGKSALSPFESEVMTRLTNFYVWYKFAPALIVTQAITEPRTLTIPYHMMNAWNGDRGDVERSYFTERQFVRTLFRIPGTDAYTAPAVFSLANSAYKWMYVIENKERGFYWSELKRDPDLMIRFLENEIGVDWLKRGGGKVTVQGNTSTITYGLTGDSISAHLNSTTNKLTIIDDSRGHTIKEFPFDSPEGKVRIYKEKTLTDTIERAIGEYGARTLLMPIELVIRRDFKFGAPIDDRWEWLQDQWIGTPRRSIETFWDPTIDWKEKVADLAIGWFINHISENRMIPHQDKTLEPLNEIIGIKIAEIERGDYYGCGA